MVIRIQNTCEAQNEKAKDRHSLGPRYGAPNAKRRKGPCHQLSTGRATARNVGPWPADNSVTFETQYRATRLISVPKGHGPSRTKQTALIVRREFLLNQPVQMLSHRWVVETLDDFVQKAGD